MKKAKMVFRPEDFYALMGVPGEVEIVGFTATSDPARVEVLMTGPQFPDIPAGDEAPVVRWQISRTTEMNAGNSE